MENKSKIIYAELCYKLYGLFYEVHNSLGRYCKEKQYADALEKLLNREKIKYNREFELTFNIAKEEIKRNRVDFLIDNRLLIVNFREKYIKPKRILNTLVNE